MVPWNGPAARAASWFLGAQAPLRLTPSGRLNAPRTDSTQMVTFGRAAAGAPDGGPVPDSGKVAVRWPSMTGDSRSVVIMSLMSAPRGGPWRVGRRSPGSASTLMEPTRSWTGRSMHWWATPAGSTPVELRTQLPWKTAQAAPFTSTVPVSGCASHDERIAIPSAIAVIPRTRNAAISAGDPSGRVTTSPDSVTAPSTTAAPGSAAFTLGAHAGAAATASPSFRSPGVSAVVMPDRIHSTPARSQGRKSRCRADPRLISHANDAPPDTLSPRRGAAPSVGCAQQPFGGETRTLLTCRGQQLPGPG